MSQIYRLIDNPQIILEANKKFPQADTLHLPSSSKMERFIQPSWELIYKKDSHENQNVPKIILTGSHGFTNGLIKTPLLIYGQSILFYLPSNLIHSVRSMIGTDKSVSEILLFIRKNKNSSRS